MTVPLFWPVVNVTLSLILSAILTHKLVSWRDKFNCAERVGMGLMAGCVLLTVPAVWSTDPTPFDDWAASGLRLGAVVYFSGRLLRHYRHWRGNAQATRQAEDHFARK